MSAKCSSSAISGRPFSFDLTHAKSGTFFKEVLPLTAKIKEQKQN